MQKRIFSAVFCLFLGLNQSAFGQEYTAYGIKGGSTFGFQNWNGSTSDLLVLPLGNGSIFTEVYAGGRSSLCLELGYHERGSAIIQRSFQYADPNTGVVTTYPATVLQRKFSNIVLQGAFKQLYDIGGGWGGYYMLGARVEYTVRDTIPFLYNQAIPVNTGLNRFNYGITVGGGVERRLGSSPLLMQIEMQVQPDFSAQIQSPALPYYDVFTRNNAVFPEQKISNVTLELTLGFKFAAYPEEEETP